ncbi:MAG: Eco57I restriction-modification methylase domain-containing protein [Dehalococcoidia bacterium]
MKTSTRAAERDIAGLAVALGAEDRGGPLSAGECRLVSIARSSGNRHSAARIRALRTAVRDGGDPLGELLCEARSQERRRALGSFFTDRSIVDAMTRWIAQQRPSEVVDCGAGSGRFTLAAARIPSVRSVVAIDRDPLACLVTRANAAAVNQRGLTVRHADFVTLALAPAAGIRAFVGNPPYVRHHQLTQQQKQRARALAAALNIPWSGLAGLHAHFLVKAAELSRPGDVLCFITSAEWIDVNYGQGIRQLLMDGLRAEELHLLRPGAAAFPDASTTALIVCARAGGATEQVRVRNAQHLSGFVQLALGGQMVPRAALQSARAWGRIVRRDYNEADESGAIQLGSIARVHRGVVTGRNDFFVMTNARARTLGLERSVRPVVTSAEEVLHANGTLRSDPTTRVLLCPPELHELPKRDREALLEYIKAGEAQGVHETYVASHRSPWWRPQVKGAPPIVATYMARQAPAFALNPEGLLILNVMHGIYPIVPLDAPQLAELAALLNRMRESYRGHGRVYHGGLEKFEPREMERLILKPDNSRNLAMLCDA